MPQAILHHGQGPLDLQLPVEARLDPDARLWAAFAAADSTRSLCRTWLALQCRNLGEVDAAMLLLARPDGQFAPMAVWPDASQSFDHLKPVAEACLRSGAPEVVRPPHPSGATGLHVGYPFLGEADRPVGAVVLDLRPRPEEAAQRALRSLHWGVGWLEAQALRDRMAQERQRVSLAASALDLVAVANEHDCLEASAMAVVNELAVRLGASRVALGLAGRKGARLMALSHTAWFKRGTTLVRAVEAAMDEAMDQRATVRLPPTPGNAVRIEVAHEVLRAAWDAEGVVATFVLPSDRGGPPAGAITVLLPEAPALPARGGAASGAAALGAAMGATQGTTIGTADDAVRLGEAAAALLGPILDAKRRARRLVSGRIADWARDGLAAAAGPRHLGWKLGGAAAAAAVAASLLVPQPFRVSAKAMLEGRTQRVAAAPFEGFIASAPVHAGDVVRQGDVLATLDDKDLLLERVRWASERERLALRAKEAMAKHDRAVELQTEAQIRQAEAQLALASEKLARTQVTAPIDGLVVSGDLSQSIGAPVETGKVLFEVAPLDEYRVIVRADERDVRYIRPGQAGQVLLHGLSGDALPFTVDRVTSVAETDGGRNTFRVEGLLAPGVAHAGLRPGMEGVGKVVVGEHSVAWVWTRGLVDWVRMLLWSWTP